MSRGHGGDHLHDLMSLFDAAGLIMTGVAAMQEYESEAEEWADWEEETRLADGRFRVN